MLRGLIKCSICLFFFVLRTFFFIIFYKLNTQGFQQVPKSLYINRCSLTGPFFLFLKMVPNSLFFCTQKWFPKSLFLSWFGGGSPVSTVNRKRQALNTFFLKLLWMISFSPWFPHANLMIIVQPVSWYGYLSIYELKFVINNFVLETWNYIFFLNALQYVVKFKKLSLFLNRSLFSL